ncbi:phytanoyl-CoA dioxygenase family protein [Streptomyces sp. NPDC021622]|uniref:phytanoyl-CoA dioxygenase family protein n=1 Tax=Streptomyces sp. NPDC021622 TaxID=3155013 RepID=UPI0033DC6D74
MIETDDGHLAELTAEYEENGWCHSPFRFTGPAVSVLRDSLDTICRRGGPEVVHEPDSTAVRAVHGCHEFDEAYAALVRHPYLLALAEALTGTPVYVYQFKVNLKQAREGQAWPWHQDFAFWNAEDGLPTPAAVTLAVPLDDVHEGNGPLMLIPGSHRVGYLGPGKITRGDSGDWRKNFAADPEHVMDDARAQELIGTFGSTRATGPAGTIQAFHPNIVHSSSDNTSPDRRALLMVSYNSIDNAPPHPTRPEFLVGRNTDQLKPRWDDRFPLERVP